MNGLGEFFCLSFLLSLIGTPGIMHVCVMSICISVTGVLSVGHAIKPKSLRMSQLVLWLVSAYQLSLGNLYTIYIIIYTYSNM